MRRGISPVYPAGVGGMAGGGPPPREAACPSAAPEPISLSSYSASPAPPAASDMARSSLGRSRPEAVRSLACFSNKVSRNITKATGTPSRNIECIDRTNDSRMPYCTGAGQAYGQVRGVQAEVGDEPHAQGDQHGADHRQRLVAAGPGHDLTRRDGRDQETQQQGGQEQARDQDRKR